MRCGRIWIYLYREISGGEICKLGMSHRNPSRHRLEEHLVFNWIKHNRELMNKGEMTEERVEMFRAQSERMGRIGG